MTYILGAHLAGSRTGALAASAFVIQIGDVPGYAAAILGAGATADARLCTSIYRIQRYFRRGAWMLTTADRDRTRAFGKNVPAFGDATAGVFGLAIAFNKKPSSHALGRPKVCREARRRIPRFMRNKRSVRVEFETLIKAFE